MKPQWDAQITQIASAIEMYRELSTKLPPSFNTSQGIPVTTEELGRAFEQVYTALLQVYESINVDPILLGIHQSGVLNPIGQIAAMVNNLRANPAQAQQFLDQIAQQLWALRASLVWLLPSTVSLGEFCKTVAEFDLETKIASLQRLTTEYAEAVSKAKDVSNEIVQQQQQISSLVDSIKASERETSTAKTNSESSAATAASNKEAIAQQLTELVGGNEELSRLLTEVESLREKAVSTLESTSKVALAASFSSRADELAKARKWWLGAFITGITAMLVATIAGLLGVLNLPPVFQNNQLEFGSLLARAAVFGPLIWFTWFSVRQYGNTVKLIEDYAFKEASALAFVGYQREMGDDNRMIQLLRESAINNFGSQPTRIFEKSDPASPLHELLDKALEKGAVDKFIELVKALSPGKR
ncbi:MAG TPA: hypothetical protein VF811_08990 [Parasulfuritortus sp.]